MKKVAIGCGVLLLLLIAVVVGIVALGYAIIQNPNFQAALNPGGNQLVGVLQLGDVEVRPASPTPDDAVIFLVNASYGGTLAEGKDELEVRILVQEVDDESVQVGTATLKRAVEEPSDELRGAATIRWGAVSKGPHKFRITLLPPPQGLLGAIHAAKEVQLDVKEAEFP